MPLLTWRKARLQGSRLCRWSCVGMATTKSSGCSTLPALFVTCRCSCQPGGCLGRLRASFLVPAQDPQRFDRFHDQGCSKSPPRPCEKSGKGACALAVTISVVAAATLPSGPDCGAAAVSAAASRFCSSCQAIPSAAPTWACCKHAMTYQLPGTAQSLAPAWCHRW